MFCKTELSHDLALFINILFQAQDDGCRDMVDQLRNVIKIDKVCLLNIRFVRIKSY